TMPRGDTFSPRSLTGSDPPSRKPPARETWVLSNAPSTPTNQPGKGRNGNKLASCSGGVLPSSGPDAHRLVSFAAATDWPRAEATRLKQAARVIRTIGKRK